MSKPLKQEILDTSPQAPLPVIHPDNDALLQMIERVATNPAANVDAMQKLLDMQERILNRNALSAYTAAMVDMKPKLPVIDRKGRIEIPGRKDTQYALWEDIDEAITPILAEHGFALTFRSGTTQEGKLTVTGVLAHRDGHSEETTVTLPHDSSGSKNAVQAVKSSMSYGQRITATLILNLRTRGEDDDGRAGGSTFISDKQRLELTKLADDAGADKRKFCENYMKVESFAHILARDYAKAKTALEAKKNGGKI